MSLSKLTAAFSNIGCGDELFIVGEFYLSALADVEISVRQTEAMNKSEDERRREMIEHSANALRLFDEARQIQRQLPSLPFFKRQSAMEKVNALEQEAVKEAHKSIALEKQLEAN